MHPDLPNWLLKSVCKSRVHLVHCVPLSFGRDKQVLYDVHGDTVLSANPSSGFLTLLLSGKNIGEAMPSTRKPLPVPKITSSPCSSRVTQLEATATFRVITKSRKTLQSGGVIADIVFFHTGSFQSKAVGKLRGRLDKVLKAI